MSGKVIPVFPSRLVFKKEKEAVDEFYFILSVVIHFQPVIDSTWFYYDALMKRLMGCVYRSVTVYINPEWDGNHKKGKW